MERKLDSKGRWRNKIVAFRVSEEEGRQIDDCVKMTGLTKQDYILKRLLCREVIVQPNTRVYKALRDKMAEIYEELRRIETVSKDDEELLDMVSFICQIVNGFKEDKG